MEGGPVREAHYFNKILYFIVAGDRREFSVLMARNLFHLYVFFWVFPRRPSVVCRRFGTLYQFHLQGLSSPFADVSEPSIGSIFKGSPALEDGTDRGFRNVGKPQSAAGEIPKRIHTIFKTRRKSEIKKP